LCTMRVCAPPHPDVRRVAAGCAGDRECANRVTSPCGVRRLRRLFLWPETQIVPLAGCTRGCTSAPDVAAGRNDAGCSSSTMPGWSVSSAARASLSEPATWYLEVNEYCSRARRRSQNECYKQVHDTHGEALHQNRREGRGSDECKGHCQLRGAACARPRSLSPVCMKGVFLDEAGNCGTADQ
jgi:hypothetical protein